MSMLAYKSTACSLFHDKALNPDLHETEIKLQHANDAAVVHAKGAEDAAVPKYCCRQALSRVCTK